MKLNKLVSRRSDGGLQMWQVEIEGNKYRAISGKLDGKQVINEWTECAGKNIGRANATTPEAQAEFEARALWQKKYDSGYREKESELEEVTLFEPMLAAKWEDKKDKVKFPLWVNPKLDGIRMIAKTTGLFTRTGKPHTNMEHVWKDLQPVFAKYKSIVIDGEAYGDCLSDRFNEIVHLVRQAKPTLEDKKASAEVIKYHVFDCMFVDKPNMIYSERLKKIKEILKDIPSVVIVDAKLVNNQEEMDIHYAEVQAAGYEGQIIRCDSEYENKRTTALLKRKDFLDKEFKVKDILEGIGNRAGMAGAILLEDVGKAGIRGDEKYFKELLKNKSNLIGQLATVRYQGVTPDGRLRFPVMIAMRPDGD